jgi:hypothetical protein
MEDTYRGIIAPKYPVDTKFDEEYPELNRYFNQLEKMLDQLLWRMNAANYEDPNEYVLAPSANTANYVPQWDGANSKKLKDGLAVGTGNNNLVQLDGSARLPAVNGSQLTDMTKSQVGLGNVDNNKQMPIAGGTFTGKAYAQENTDYTTAQIRSVILSTADASGSANNGTIWLKYTA